MSLSSRSVPLVIAPDGCRGGLTERGAGFSRVNVSKNVFGPRPRSMSVSPTPSASAGAHNEGPDRQGPGNEGTESVVERFGTSWSDHDLDAAIAMLTDDCIFDSTGPAPDGESVVGPAAIRAAWQSIFDDVDAQFITEEQFTAGDRMVQRWCYEWDGGLVRSVDHFLVRDGKIAEKRSYVKL